MMVLLALIVFLFPCGSSPKAGGGEILALAGNGSRLKSPARRAMRGWRWTT
jgi:hypothetical protein